MGLKAEQLTTLAEAFGITLDKLIGRPPPRSRGTDPRPATQRARHHRGLMIGQASLKGKAATGG